MFSSKSIRGKWTWAFVDLLVVIIGVYIAFLIQSSAAAEKDKKEQEKVFTALKFELEHFRLQMPGMSGYVNSEVEKYMATIKSGDYSNFTDWRFIQPQYSYQIIEYAISIQNTEIINFELYDALQKLFVEIKKLEHAESLIMETSMRYQTIPEGLPKTDPLYQMTWANNYDNFGRFITFMNDRARVLQAIADASQATLPIINEKLGEEKTREIEKQFILSNASKVKNEDQAVALVKRIFPDFTEEEVRELYRQASQTKTTPADSPGQ
ncbi:MAG: hypothetical protein RLN88_01035 [Ekhidna sp.]|uniref:hypothetical protein n=1 Tax=Ekhidna sp. TaxID=2608089 RepID=UPI0032EF95ED